VCTVSVPACHLSLSLVSQVPFSEPTSKRRKPTLPRRPRAHQAG
jgi:hypothetical protein